MTSRESAIKTILKAAERWPSSFVARAKAKDFSGGAVSPGYLANLDSAGLGPKGSFKIGRQVVYPTDAFCSWLIERVAE